MNVVMLKLFHNPTKFLVGRNSVYCSAKFMNFSTENKIQRKTFADSEPVEINSENLTFVQTLIPKYIDNKNTEIPFRHSDQFWMQFSKDKSENANKLFPKSPYNEIWGQSVRYLHQYRHKHDDMSAKYETKQDITEDKLKRQQLKLESLRERKKESEEKSEKAKNISEKLSIVLKQYGAFGMFVHIVLSLISLGLMYLLLTMGFDINSFIKKMGFDLTATQAGMSTFMVAYTLHKLILPVRASLTVVTIPLLVRYLRRVGYFKNK